MNPRPLFIAGVGNLFLGDDAFGCEVLRRLSAERREQPLPNDVELRDFGASVRALGYVLAAHGASRRCGRGTTVIVDAVATGAAPGTLQLFDLAAGELPAPTPLADHGCGVEVALAVALALGAELEGTYLLGCEAGSLEPAYSDQPAQGSGLSPSVELAAGYCVELLRRAIAMPHMHLVALYTT